MILPKPRKHDQDLLEVGGHQSFHDSWGNATLYCWALKRHIEDLAQHGYLDEFILNQEEYSEVGGAQPILSTKALTHQHNPRGEDPQEAMKLFLLETILCVKPCNIQ